MIPAELTGGPHFEAFASRYLRHTKGRWAGQPLIFEDWQQEFWWEALEVDPATGLRVYTEVGLGLPRKNGKSTMTAGAGLYLLTADGEPEPEIYTAAAARAQAGIVLGQARTMARNSPMLRDYLKVYRYSIECPRNGGIMRSLSSDAPLQHGLNPSGTIIDELHAHESGELYTALTTGGGAREQPLTLWISTAGIAGEGILAQLYESMFNGPGQLDRRPGLLVYRDRANGMLIYWYGAEQDADIENPDLWKLWNPASWLQNGKYLRTEYEKMKARGGLLEFRRYHTNQFVAIEEAWLPEGAWLKCENKDLKLDPNLPVGIGVDKGQTSDLGGIVVAQQQGKRIVVRAQVFRPEAATGRVSTTAMRQHILALRDAFPQSAARDVRTKRILPGPAVAYDPWAFSESAEQLEHEGVNMVLFNQWASTMGPASTLTYELITTGRIAHDGDPVLGEHVRNTTAVLTERGMKVAKPKKPSVRKNDLCVALVMAVAMAMQEAPTAFVRKPRVGVGF